MNHKKGFALIELLAVITVLAVILAITIPAVTGIVNSARRKVFSESVRLIVTAAINKGGNDGTLDLASIDVTNVKAVLGVKNTNYNFVSLNKDNDSIYLVVSGRGEWSNLKACGTYHDMVVTDLSDASVCPEVVVDTDPGVICDYETELVCYIRSVEDLTAFSVMVNDTKHNYDFTNHTVILDTNLDIENPASYVSPTTTAFGDVNSDGFTSSLIRELTTDKGFQPIGSQEKRFKGIFEGKLNTIANLYINRPKLLYTGMFGYNSGIIRGFSATGFNITGGAYTAGIAAYNTGMISSIVFNGSINSNQNEHIGYISSYNTATVNSVFILNSTIVPAFSGTGTIAPGKQGTEFNTYGLMKDSSNGHYPYPYIFDFSNTDNTNLYLGSSSDENLNNELNAYGTVLDTWVGGDNDSDGYYFDYNSSDQVVLKSVADNPMTFSLAGSGTENDPYLINDYSDWKQATLKVRNGYYFKLTDNINFSGKKYYAMGDNHNYFSGTFDGNSKEVSNINFMLFVDGGMFGLNNGVIKDLTINNLTLNGTMIGGITGNNYGIIRGVNIRNLDITGGHYIGGVAYRNTGSIIGMNVEDVTITLDPYVGSQLAGGIAVDNNGIISSINFQGLINVYSGSTGGIAAENYDGKITNVLVNANLINRGNSYSTTGGIAGTNASDTDNNHSNDSSIYGIVEGGSIVVTVYFNNIGKLIGKNVGAYSGYSSSTVILANSFGQGVNGINFASTYDNNLAKYDEYGLDTKYGGDNDGDGYYFDYNSDSSNIIVKSIAIEPIITTPVTYPDVEEPAGTDTNESSCSIASGCTAQGTKSVRCGYTYLYNSTPISGYQSGYTFSMTRGSSCATAVADNTDGGLIIYTGKKSTATGSCSVVLKIMATGGTYNCASTKYSSFTFN